MSCVNIGRFIGYGGFLNRGTPKSSMLVGFFPYKPSSYWGTPMSMETPLVFLWLIRHAPFSDGHWHGDIFFTT